MKKDKYFIAENNNGFYCYYETKKQFKKNEKIRKKSLRRITKEESANECLMTYRTYCVVKIKS